MFHMATTHSHTESQPLNSSNLITSSNGLVLLILMTDCGYKSAELFRRHHAGEVCSHVSPDALRHSQVSMKIGILNVPRQCCGAHYVKNVESFLY